MEHETPTGTSASYIPQQYVPGMALTVVCLSVVFGSYIPGTWYTWYLVHTWYFEVPGYYVIPRVTNV